jgi:hypothetical protein
MKNHYPGINLHLNSRLQLSPLDLRATDCS